MSSILDRKLGFVVRLLRIKANLSQRELASVVGVSQPTVSRWENGEALPDNSQASTVCRLLDDEGCLSTLLDLRNKGLVGRLGARLRETVSVLLESMPSPAVARHGSEVPYFADVAAGVGEAQEERSAPRSYIEVPRHIFNRDPECYALRVTGDSMEPLLREGDIIVVSPAAPLPEGCLVAAYVEPAGDVVKVLNYTGGGSIRLKSLNPDYPDIHLAAEEGPAGRIWGRVILQQREL